jgi:hypothetical protein
MVGFQRTRHLNIIIGKNNVGKSSFLDVLDVATGSRIHEKLYTDNIILCSTVRNEELLLVHINKLEGNEENPIYDWERIAEHLTDIKILWTATPGAANYNKLIKTLAPKLEPYEKILKAYIQNLRSSFADKKHIRITAERDITPERAVKKIKKDDTNNKPILILESNGGGSTQILQALIHHVHDQRQLITDDLLAALNEIFNGETTFSEITTRHHIEKDIWEIFLSEDNGQLHALSQSGSGLKTIILILINLLVRPKIEATDPSKYIYSIEEIENNLHPSLQRSLFEYIEKFCVKNHTQAFITTHSHISIDMYNDSENAQILHLQKTAVGTTGSVFESHLHGYNILGDLGVRASDLLQANGIIWVEGPSDRIFLNKFISLWSDNSLKEGKHFQFAFYGGSVLADLDASPPSNSFSDAIDVLMINRNVIFVCDGDRTSSNPELKPRVKAICEQLDETQSLYWVTEGKEIENYIPLESFQMVHPKKFQDGATSPRSIGLDETILDYLTHYGVTKAKAYTDKVTKAAAYAKYFTMDNLSFRDEIDKKMREICSEIRRWNNITALD